MTEISDYDKLILSWPYRFTYAEYEAARRRAGLGVGIRTNGIGNPCTSHLYLPDPPPPPSPYAGKSR